MPQKFNLPTVQLSETGELFSHKYGRAKRLLETTKIRKHRVGVLYMYVECRVTAIHSDISEPVAHT